VVGVGGGGSGGTGSCVGVEVGANDPEFVGEDTGDDGGVGVHDGLGGLKCVDVEDGDASSFVLVGSADEQLAVVVSVSHGCEVGVDGGALVVEGLGRVPVGAVVDEGDDAHVCARVRGWMVETHGAAGI
jgi:hypothetical protein